MAVQDWLKGDSMDQAQVIENIFEVTDFMSLAGCIKWSCLKTLDAWREQQAEEILDLQSNGLAEGIKILAHATQPKLKHQEIWPDFFFGPMWDGHALRHKPFFWYKEFREPDITKLIARAMTYELDNSRRQWLCRSFLWAICNVCQQKQYVPPENVRITVECEIHTPNTGKKGYLDLLFHWGENEERCVIGIEVKFDADTKNNPFKLYEGKLLELAGNRIQPLKILLVQKIPTYNPKWDQVFWQDLLPLWEEKLKELAEKHEPDKSLAYGGQLRASIIQKIYGVLYV